MKFYDAKERIFHWKFSSDQNVENNVCQLSSAKQFFVGFHVILSFWRRQTTTWSTLFEFTDMKIKFELTSFLIICIAGGGPSGYFHLLTLTSTKKSKINGISWRQYNNLKLPYWLTSNGINVFRWKYPYKCFDKTIHTSVACLLSYINKFSVIYLNSENCHWEFNKIR